MLLRIPRHACSPRDRARAGELWRLVQEAAVQHSVAHGWPPSRYRQEGAAFVVRRLVGVHRREALYGEELAVTTHVAEVRRQMLVRRETRIAGVLDASVEWVWWQGAAGRMPASVLDAFPIEPGPGVALPEIDRVEPTELPPFPVEPWWTEMDPMAHTNHPRYVDWVDEALSRWIAAKGGDPIAMVPVADDLQFRVGARAGERIELALTRVGTAGPATAFDVEMTGPGGLYARGRVLRIVP
jgi:acyl-CoA thioesterase FadM